MKRGRPGRPDDRLKEAIISGGGGGVLNGLLRTVRMEVIAGREVEETFLPERLPVIYVLWHGRLIPCSYRYRLCGLGTLITQNRDGDYIAGVVERWGYQVVRGSSSRGGSAALREIVRLLRRGTPVALTPDGPRGPRQKMKLGPFLAARMAGVPVVPVTAGASSAWFFGRWDRFMVPRPFAWLPFAFGEPMTVKADATMDELEAQALEMEHRLNGLTELVDKAARAGRG